MSNPEAKAESPPKGVPVLYKSPVALAARQHSELKIARERNFTFARNINSVPVVLNEFGLLLAHYPVVFTNADEPLLIAIMGIRRDENLFVDEAGKWTARTYIPAYVRRYPFILMGQRLALGAELDSSFFGADGDALFENGRASKRSEAALRFCVQFQKSFQETRKFTKAVHDAGVLRSKVFTMSNREGGKAKLGGFSVIDEAAFNDLSAKTIESWRKQGWLKYAYWHLASLARIKGFPMRLEERVQTA